MSKVDDVRRERLIQAQGVKLASAEDQAELSAALRTLERVLVSGGLIVAKVVEEELVARVGPAGVATGPQEKQPDFLVVTRSSLLISANVRAST